MRGCEAKSWNDNNGEKNRTTNQNRESGQQGLVAPHFAPVCFVQVLDPRVSTYTQQQSGLGTSMQPSDIHFAAVWPTAHDGTTRRVRKHTFRQ